MYDPITSAVLFVILTPGVVVTLPPGASPLIAAIVHAIVFYVIQAFVAPFVPWWGIWIAGAVVVGGKFYMGRSTPAPALY
jgi:hypothetical protein